MELALVPLQRLARLLTQVDAESWAYEPGTYEALLASLARYESVVLLSGDIHAGFTAYADYWSAPDGEPVRTARIVQLVSSGLTKDWGDYGPAFIGHTLTHEIFESATTPTQPHAERVGWGTPLKQVPVEPPTLGDIVTVPDGIGRPSDLPRAAEDARAGGADARLAGRDDRSARPELGLARVHGARRARGVRERTRRP